MSSFKTELSKHYQRRKSQNPAYSKRAFARDLKTSIGRVSEILNGRVRVGRRLAERFARQLGLNEEETKTFIQLSEIDPTPGSTESLPQELRELFSDPEIVKLVALSCTEGFITDAKYVSSRLDIPLERAEHLLSEFNSKSLREIFESHSHAVKSLLLADTTRLQEKDMMARSEKSARVSLILPANLTEFDRANECIDRFRRQMARILSNNNCTEVYELSVTLQLITQKAK